MVGPHPFAEICCNCTYEGVGDAIVFGIHVLKGKVVHEHMKERMTIPLKLEDEERLLGIETLHPKTKLLFDNSVMFIVPLHMSSWSSFS